MSEKVNIAVFVSGMGTNIGAIYNACKKKKYPAHIKLVISNKNCNAYQLSKRLMLNTKLIKNSNNNFEEIINKYLIDYEIELICLAGFMKILSPSFTKIWKNRILNIHPSLLPFFPGLNVFEKFSNSGMKIHGSTVHIVNEKIDSGKILSQLAIPVSENEKRNTILRKLKRLENDLYVETIKQYIYKKFYPNKKSPSNKKRNSYNEFIISM